MSYTNPRHEGRLTLIPNLRDAFAILHVCEAPKGSIESGLGGAESYTLYRVDELGAEYDRDLFNFPFLLFANGEPWHEANDYLLSLMRNCAPASRRTDDIRRRASKLIDYLLFCEDKNIDWLDFSGARPLHRPTYKYFYHLINSGGRSDAVINQYTAVVYHFTSTFPNAGMTST